jgi:hypothetical protein
VIQASARTGHALPACNPAPAPGVARQVREQRHRRRAHGGELVEQLVERDVVGFRHRRPGILVERRQ